MDGYRYFLITAFLSLAGNASATIYSWIDEHGQRHYSDSAPAQHSDQSVVEVPLADINRQSPPAKIDYRRATRQPDKTAHHQRASAQRKRRQHCEKIQRRLDAINKQLRSGYREPKGNKLRQQRRDYQRRKKQHCD